MKHIIVALLAGLMALPAWATPPCKIQNYDTDKEPNYTCPSPEENAVVRPGKHAPTVKLKKGVKAPREGYLLDKGKVIDLGLKVEGLRYLRWRDRKDARGKLVRELTYTKAVGKSKHALYQLQVAELKKLNDVQAQQINKLTAWYRSPVFWFALGVVVTAAGGIAVGVATN